MAINYVELRKQLQTPSISPTVPQKLAKYFGSGLATPFQLESEATWEKKVGVDKIRQSIYTTLLTPVGRRVMQPDFGSLLTLLVFEHYTTQLQREMIRATKDALDAWVPVIRVDNVGVKLDPQRNNIVYIDVSYTIKGTVSQDVVQLALTRGDSNRFVPADYTINGRQVFAV